MSPVLSFIYMSLIPSILSHNPFDDSLLYEVNWVGPARSQQQIDVSLWLVVSWEMLSKYIFSRQSNIGCIFSE